MRPPPPPLALSYAPPPGARRAPPEPGRRYAVPITGAPATGADQPLVVLVTFSDFECPYCLGLHRNLQVLRRERPDVRLAWRDFPLPGHQRALRAALWARAAGARGKFWPMTDLLFERQHQLDLAALAAPVRALGLEPAQLERAARDPGLLATVQADVTLALSLALPGTPSVFANGRLVAGRQAQPFAGGRRRRTRRGRADPRRGRPPRRPLRHARARRRPLTTTGRRRSRACGLGAPGWQSVRRVLSCNFAHL